MFSGRVGRFSLCSIVLATVPSGEPPPEETRNTSRSVSSPGEHAERDQASTCVQVVAQWAAGALLSKSLWKWRQGRNTPASGVLVQRVLAATPCRLGPFPSSTYPTARHRSSETSFRGSHAGAGRPSRSFHFPGTGPGASEPPSCTLCVSPTQHLPFVELKKRRRTACAAARSMAGAASVRPEFATSNSLDEHTDTQSASSRLGNAPL